MSIELPLKLSSVTVLKEIHGFKMLFPCQLTLLQCPLTLFQYAGDFQLEKH